jgi:hypothetical protein
MSETQTNLDRLAAQHAQQIVERTSSTEKGEADRLATQQAASDVDNLVTKALGVLQENGVYACGLYLLSRTQDKEQKIAAVVLDELLKLAAQLPFGWRLTTWQRESDKPQRVLEFLSRTVCRELDPLLLTKDTYEQTLIYARYGAKARGAAEEEPTQAGG